MGAARRETRDVGSKEQHVVSRHVADGWTLIDVQRINVGEGDSQKI